MPTSPTIAEAVAALKAFADQLPRLPGLLVAPPVIGEPAPAEAIAHLRANPLLLPSPLVDLYELMNGCEIRWQFRNPEKPDEEVDNGGDGRLSIPALYDGLMLKTDLDNEYSFFGPTTRSVVFDEDDGLQFGTWLVVYGPDGPMPEEERRWRYHPDDYASEHEDYDDQEASAQVDVAHPRLMLQVHKDEYLPLPGTVADYLVQAIAHGCVEMWPLAWQPENEYQDWRREGEGTARERVARFHAVTGQ